MARTRGRGGPGCCSRVHSVPRGRGGLEHVQIWLRGILVDPPLPGLASVVFFPGDRREEPENFSPKSSKNAHFWQIWFSFWNTISPNKNTAGVQADGVARSPGKVRPTHQEF